jgi:hypothetical protein
MPFLLLGPLADAAAPVIANSFGTEDRVVYKDDTAELYAYLYDRQDTGVTEESLKSVEFHIKKPDGTVIDQGGGINDDGSGSINFTDTNLIGEYIVVATFILADDTVHSVRSDFQVADPFAGDLNTQFEFVRYDTLDAEEKLQWQVDLLCSRVWDKMEDTFDSQDGGPWLRDMTMNVFQPSKMPDFIEEAIFDINVYNPPTAFWIDYFMTPASTAAPFRSNVNQSLLIQGVWVAVIRHLMRSYAEQPTPQGGQVTYEDRRDYLQRWGTIYQIEFQHYDHLVKMWKRQFLGLNRSKQLVSSKAGRLLPAPLRTRNIGRGYY